MELQEALEAKVREMNPDALEYGNTAVVPRSEKFRKVRDVSAACLMALQPACMLHGTALLSALRRLV